MTNNPIGMYNPLVMTNNPIGMPNPSVMTNNPIGMYNPSVMTNNPIGMYNPLVMTNNPLVMTNNPLVMTNNPIGMYNPSVMTNNPIGMYNPVVMPSPNWLVSRPVEWCSSYTSDREVPKKTIPLRRRKVNPGTRLTWTTSKSTSSCQLLSYRLSRSIVKWVIILYESNECSS